MDLSAVTAKPTTVAFICNPYLCYWKITTPLWPTGRAIMTPLWPTGHAIMTPLWSTGHAIMTPLWSTGHVIVTPFWSTGHVIVAPFWSDGHVIVAPFWSDGHVIVAPFWSDGHVIVAPFWSDGHVIVAPFWSDGHVIMTPLWPTGHAITLLWSAGNATKEYPTGTSFRQSLLLQWSDAFSDHLLLPDKRDEISLGHKPHLVHCWIPRNKNAFQTQIGRHDKDDDDDDVVIVLLEVDLLVSIVFFGVGTQIHSCLGSHAIGAWGAGEGRGYC